MKRATFNVLFYIKRTKKLKDGTAPVYARLTVNGLRVEFALQKSIDEQRWNKEKGCIMGNKSDAKKFNSYLDLVKNRLYGYKLELEQEGNEVSAISIKNAYLGIDNNSKTILGVFNDHNIRCKGLIGIDIASGTYDRYQACYRHIDRFINHQYSKTDMSISSITPIFIRDLEYYLKTERNCCNNTTVKYIKNFKKIVNIALSNGWLKFEIIQLLIKDFVKWVVIVFVIAIPIAWYAMNKWLQIFACKTELSWWIFALAGVLALGIALVTASWQTFRTARKNPVEALKYEWESEIIQ